MPTSRSPKRPASAAALLRWVAPVRRLSTMGAAASVTRPPSHKKSQDGNAGRHGLVPPRLGTTPTPACALPLLRPVSPPLPQARRPGVGFAANVGEDDDIRRDELSRDRDRRHG